MDDLRETIARAIAGDDAHQIWDDPDQCECCVGWKRDMYTRQADAVIAALGLREERRPGATTTLNDSVWTRPDKRRYITDWEVDE